jgi:hypothetical protein
VKLVPSSPRARRRLAWCAALAAAAAVLGALVALLPKGTQSETTRSGGKQFITKPREKVPLSAADRKTINATLTAFVRTAVARREVGASYELVTAALRAGKTRAEWARGTIPVFPYAARGKHFDGWRLKYSYRGDVGFDLTLQPRVGSKLGAVTFAVEMKRVHGRWLIDSFTPTAVFAPVGAAPRITTAQDFRPPRIHSRPTTALLRQASGSSESAFNRLWLIAPAALLGLALLVPLTLLLVGRVRGYHPARGRLPPLPSLTREARRV